MGKTQIEILERDGKYISAPKGISMLPMIKGGRDAALVVKLSSPPKRYDLVMYARTEDVGVIHRVIRFKNSEYIICGDNCWQLEHVKPEQIYGIVTEFSHKGKWYKIDNRLYRIYVHLWVDLLFIKRPVFRLRDKLKRKFKK